MFNVCKVLIWLIMLAPLAMVAVLFGISPRLGLIGLGIIVAAAGLYLGCGFLVTRARELCPACDARKLKLINWFRVNPPPNRSHYRCEQCGKEYVKVDGRRSGMVEREESPFTDSGGWDAL